MDEPDDYAFPLLTALYAASKHGLGFDSPEFQDVVARKKIGGDKTFDLYLAQQILV